MRDTARNIARNTAWLIGGSVLQKLISFVYFSVIAAAFGVTGTGRYFFALTFAALFVVAADWGIAPVLTREIAKDRERGSVVLARAFALRAGCTLVTVVVMTAAAFVLGYPVETREMIALATVILVTDTIQSGCFAVLRGLQRVHYEAIGNVLGQLVLTTSGIGILVVVAGLRIGDGGLLATRVPHGAWFLVPYLLTSIVNAGVAITGCVRERVRPTFAVSVPWRATATWLFRIATPFAIAGGLARLYTYSDTLLLQSLSSEAEVGYYSVPFKIAFAFQFIPLAFMGALYPAMSAAAARARTELPILLEQAVRVLLLIACPLAVGIGVLAPRIITQLYGHAFDASITPLMLLIASVPFVFVNFPFGYLLNAMDRQTTNTKLIAIATAVNVGANVVLIPPFGATGAALSALIGSAALTVLNAIAAHRAVSYRVRVLGSALLRMVIACIAMSVAVLASRPLPLAVTIGIGAAAFCITAFVVRAVRAAELHSFALLFARRNHAAPAHDV